MAADVCVVTECSLWFVESSMIVAKHMKDFSEARYGPPDEAQLMRTVVPSLVSQALKSLTEVKYSKEQVANCIEVSGGALYSSFYFP